MITTPPMLDGPATPPVSQDPTCLLLMLLFILLITIAGLYLLREPVMRNLRAFVAIRFPHILAIASAMFLVGMLLAVILFCWPLVAVYENSPTYIATRAAMTTVSFALTGAGILVALLAIRSFHDRPIGFDDALLHLSGIIARLLEGTSRRGQPVFLLFVGEYPAAGAVTSLARTLPSSPLPRGESVLPFYCTPLVEQYRKMQERPGTRFIAVYDVSDGKNGKPPWVRHLEDYAQRVVPNDDVETLVELAVGLNNEVLQLWNRDRKSQATSLCVLDCALGGVGRYQAFVAGYYDPKNGRLRPKEGILMLALDAPGAVNGIRGEQANANAAQGEEKDKDVPMLGWEIHDRRTLEEVIRIAARRATKCDTARQDLEKLRAPHHYSRGRCTDCNDKLYEALWEPR